MHIQLISFKNVSPLKFPNEVIIENCVLICKYISQAFPKKLFNNITPGGLKQVVLKYFFILQNYVEDI